jgi:hypothetical protein
MENDVENLIARSVGKGGSAALTSINILKSFDKKGRRKVAIWQQDSLNLLRPVS